MRPTILFTLIICLIGCSEKMDNWVIYEDPFNIGSISLPSQPNETRDTVATSAFKLVTSINMTSIDNKTNSPSTFCYDLYFPTDIKEFDLFQMKKDSNTVNRLFDNMIQGTLRKSNSRVSEKKYFDYPEPGVKVTMLNNVSNDIGVCRIIIFDNYVIMTSAVGRNDEFSEDVEDEFFKSLKINSENRNRR